ncbi:MAG: hypothetical protein FD123_424 [Bacteroidetes bacterium]|nr:MAG: hypothetical protein FD123_424 [Bacteroidota bacterium]
MKDVKRTTSPELERTIAKKHGELKETAQKDARHFAKDNRPVPTDTNLDPYVGSIRAEYQKLILYTHQFLQPAALSAEASRMVRDGKQKLAHIASEIAKRIRENDNDSYTLGKMNIRKFILGAVLALVISLLVFAGETAFNNQAFQVTGESLIFTLAMSASISCGVFALAHIAPLMYKSAPSDKRKRQVVLGAGSIVVVLSIALANLRSLFFSQELTVSPVYFVIINLFLFAVSALCSYYLLPSREELKEKQEGLKLYFAIEERKAAIEKLEAEKIKIETEIDEKLKQDIWITNYSATLSDYIQKLCRETIEEFKKTNLIHRLDRAVPECFNAPVPDLEKPTVA